MSLTKVDPAVRTAIFDARQHPRKPHLFKCDGSVCGGRYFVRTALQIDHIVPEADSFPDQRNDPANFQLLCAPKGSTWVTSCHKQKTRREAKRRAALNTLPRRWNQAILAGTGSACSLSYLWHDSAESLLWPGLVGMSVLSTKLVKNAFDSRPPRKIIPKVSATTSAPGPVLDAERIVEAAREAIGPKGVITATGSPEKFLLTYAQTGFADHQDDRKFDLIQRISAKTGERWLPVWDTRKDQVTFNRRPVLERMIYHPGLPEKRLWHQIPIAPDVNIDLKLTPHVLIIGTTSVGKTAAMRTIIAAVADTARRDDSTRCILADPKRIEMPGFKGWPGIREVVSDTDDLWDMAFDLEKEMNDRLWLIESKKAKTSDFKKIICVIDEYEQYFKRMHRKWTTDLDEDGKPLKKGGARVPPPIDAIQSVLSMARRVNIHLIIGTQSPDASWFGGTGTRENMSGRIAVGPVDSVRARMMFDDSSVGRDIPIEFKGRATVQVGDGAPQEVQIYYTPDPFDPDETNTDVDWECLTRVGMPERIAA